MKRIFIFSFICLFPVVSMSGEIANSRPDKKFLDTPYQAKQMQRSIFDMGNEGGETVLKQLKRLEKKNSNLDDDMKTIMSRGIKMMEKMEYGLQEEDIKATSALIEQNPDIVLTEVTDKVKNKAVAEDAFLAMDIIEPAKRLNKKVDKDKKYRRINYQIDLSEFE
jgi:hypothetical protein